MPIPPAQPLPPRFDPALYRQLNPDLSLGDDEAAAAHWAATGRAAGRVGGALATRDALVAALDPHRPLLEIGPFCQPLAVGPGVEYLDRLDAGGLRRRAALLGLDPSRCPERIHHLHTLDDVPAGRFEAVLAAHAIEHQPDLVRHLEAVARVLQPGGRYWLVIPDKRYCFDHFLPETTIADVLAAWTEKRRVHGVKSVVEHGALVTHNDPLRHWAGDHGDTTPAEQRRRVGEALAAYRAADGGYLDVHAWQFTPDGFAALLELLAATGLSAFEVDGVWDTPRDRAEFVAVLRRARAPDRSVIRNDEPAVRLLQSADAVRYLPMLAVTQPNVAGYARRHGYQYEAFVGIKRGYWPWQATFNRIAMLEELRLAGVGGWAVYLDTDAYVRDPRFDLRAYLHAHRERAAVFATAGTSAHRWDVNAGVALINLDHPAGRALVAAWAARLAAVPDADLLAATDWAESDQDLLHAVLRDQPEIAAAIHVESQDLLNSGHASFIRQRMRAHGDGVGDRIAALADEVAAVAAANAAGELPAALPAGGRAAARTLHPLGVEPRLEEALPGAAADRAAAAALAAWQAAPEATEPGLDALLAAGDLAGLAGYFATLGRQPAARGLLGGDRQHARAAADPAFARERARRSHDALLSLAELTGAVPVESPDLGPWGRTTTLAAPDLFAAVERQLAAELLPPATIGGWLGVGVAPGRVLHLRMVEAIHLAWRVGEVRALTGAGAVLELDGGLGLTAWYAARLGQPGWRLHAPGPLVAGVLADLAAPVAAPADLLVADALAPRPAAEIADLLAHEGRWLLHVGQDAADEAGKLAELFHAAGWRRVQRLRHGMRPGQVEELFRRG